MDRSKPLRNRVLPLLAHTYITTAASSHAQQSEQKETFTPSLLARGMSTIEAQFFWKNIVIGSDFHDHWVI